MMRLWLVWVVLAAIPAAQTALAACGGTFTGPKGTLKSPRYPKRYPTNQKCVYTILASPDARLKLWCKKSVLEESVGCTKDYINVNGLFICGNTRITNMYGQGNLTLEFVSDDSSNKKGFLCYYNRVTGGEYVEPSTPGGGEVSCAGLLEIKSEWSGGWNGYLRLPVHSTSSSWKVDLRFSLPLTSFEQWTGTTEKHSNTWFSVTKNHGITAGSTLSFDFLYRYPADTERPAIVMVTLNGQDLCTDSGEGTTTPDSGEGTTTPDSGEGTTTPDSGEGTTAPDSRGSTTTPENGCTNATYNYDEVLHKSLLFYEAQRSGYLPPSNRVSWRRDSATDDAIDPDTGERVDLVGGYYDAGDYVKFGYPMSAAATVLAWGAIQHRAAYTSAGEMENMVAAVKWATDYFLKCHRERHILYGQVGRGDLDHSYWGQPEDMTMQRPAYKITESKPGSDLAGDTSAALAAASILVRGSDPKYSATCLLHAQQLYHFANTFRGKYSDSIPDAANYYYSYGVYDDELAWAAIWLYYATGNSSYLSQAKAHYSQINIDGVGEFSWAEKTPGVQVLLVQLADPSDRPTYRQHLQKFCDKIIDHAPRTPKKLVFISKWGALRYAANVAYICLRAADLGIKSEHYRSFGKEQIHYMLGSTGRSYVVGFGVNPPQRPHHASSSCKDPPASCGWQDFHSSEPNPQVLYGALVGGPDQNDNYNDAREDYISNEVTCDYNAGFQSAVAALRELSHCEGDIETSTRPPETSALPPETSTRPPETTTLPPRATTTVPEMTTSSSETTSQGGGGSSCASVVPDSEWTGNVQAYLTLTVPSDVNTWAILLTLSEPVDNFQVWDAEATPTSGSSITLTNKSYNGVQAGGATLTIKFWITYSGARPMINSISFNGISQCLN